MRAREGARKEMSLSTGGESMDDYVVWGRSLVVGENASLDSLYNLFGPNSARCPTDRRVSVDGKDRFDHQPDAFTRRPILRVERSHPSHLRP